MPAEIEPVKGARFFVNFFTSFVLKVRALIKFSTKRSAKVASRTRMRPRIENKNFLRTRKIDIAFYFLRCQLAKAALLSATPEKPGAKNKILLKAARFLSQLFHKFRAQSACPDKIFDKALG